MEHDVKGAALQASKSQQWAEAAFNELLSIPDTEQVEAIELLMTALHNHRIRITEESHKNLEYNQNLLHRIMAIMPERAEPDTKRMIHAEG